MKLSQAERLLLKLYREHYVKENMSIYITIIDVILKENEVQVLKHFKILIKLNRAVPSEPDTMFMLSICYLGGYGVEEDLERGIFYLKQAHALGSILATSFLGLIYFEGKGSIKKDIAEGFNLLSKATKNNNSSALVLLAMVYFSGNSIPKDFTEYLRLLKMAHKEGSLVAQILLAQLYDVGADKCLEPDKKKAQDLMQMAADQGDSGSKCAIGHKLCQKNDNDFEKGLNLFKQAAEQGDGAGWFFLGWYSRQQPGLSADVWRKIEYLQHAAASDSLYTFTMDSLLRLLYLHQIAHNFDPKNTQERMKATLEYFLKEVPNFKFILQLQANTQEQFSSSTRGHSRSLARYNLGFLLYHRVAVPHYLDCRIMEKGYQEIDILNAAVKLIKSAAKDRNPAAQFHLAYLHERGIGVPRSPALMCHYYRMASENGFIAATFPNNPNLIIYEKLLQETEILEPIKNQLTNLFFMYKKEICNPEITSIMAEYAYDNSIRLINRLQTFLFMFSAFSCNRARDMDKNKKLAQVKISSIIADYSFEDLANGASDKNEHPMVRTALPWK